ncbi:MAG: peptide chain release factor 2 [Alphaproteobacteria bacterium]|nr:peptide chain release factor 2 [Alphaproteobacteria bacterium]MBV9015837.1 peptide chain release factor 2 [Alphaproteobacteria bacterium]MBV9153968.1 peptide chain release factor 2 [Alphaproteobacteria bacterium]MBV9583770.1 peptide chain release factor 2 [Alphaproteobacteria bacterium]MBV9966414.1 peptide chain release factor 2 [Alphaproteobacteria bacterium]
MRAEIQAVADDIRKSLALLRRHLDWEAANKRLAELNSKAEDPKLWDDPAAAQSLLRERTRLERAIEGYRRIEREVDDAVELIELGDAEGDRSVVVEAEGNLERLREEARKRELESLLSGEADANDCYLEVHAGAGGTEAQDWAEMLLRMYVRWAEDHDYKVEWLEESAGEGAGIKSATVKVSGVDAYGWLKTESGVHRLVRISPFDSNARRHTSFASVWVYPVIDDKFEVEIQDKYLRVDTYRASGAGGQHVNKTDSAVRMTYTLPGSEPIVVACQSERSQHQNRASAQSMLRARIYELELQKRDAKIEAMNAAKTDIGWGHQIRSYVLQPYQMVKDLRTGVETGNTGAVLDGDIDRFLAAALAQRIEGADALASGA